MFAAAAMSLSSFCVVSNALRLNLLKIIKFTKAGDDIMKIEIKIEGMMCPHCEAHVKKALLGVNGVISAEVSHTEKRAVVNAEDFVKIDDLNTAVVNAGYKIM